MTSKLRDAKGFRDCQRLILIYGYTGSLSLSLWHMSRIDPIRAAHEWYQRFNGGHAEITLQIITSKGSLRQVKEPLKGVVRSIEHCVASMSTTQTD